MADNYDNINRIAGQLESIEKYLTRDIDRQNQSIAELYYRINELEKLVEKVRGMWIIISVGGTVAGTIIGWAIQIGLSAVK